MVVLAYRIVSDAIIYSTKCAKYNSLNKDKGLTKNDWKKWEQGRLHIPEFQGCTQQSGAFSIPYAEWIILWFETPLLKIIYHWNNKSTPTRHDWKACS